MYEKGIKQNQNNPMESTVSYMTGQVVLQHILCRFFQLKRFALCTKTQSKKSLAMRSGCPTCSCPTSDWATTNDSNKLQWHYTRQSPNRPTTFGQSCRLSCRLPLQVLKKPYQFQGLHMAACFLVKISFGVPTMDYY